VVGCCEGGNEPSGYVKCEFLGLLGKCWRLKMDSAPQVNLVVRLVFLEYRRCVDSGLFVTTTTDVSVSPVTYFI
jgi:hypothetical protein